MSESYIGEIRTFAFGYAPDGWLLCDGSLYPVSAYEALYSVISTTYGGDGATFAVPDFRGRAPVHRGAGPGLSNYFLGQRAGVESVALTSAHLPTHTHPIRVSTAAAGFAAPASDRVFAAVTGDTLYATGGARTSLAFAGTTFAGGGQPHENRAPGLALTVAIAWTGVFPRTQ